MSQAVNVSELSLSREDLLRPFAVHIKLPWKDAQEFNYLGNMVVVFSVFSTRLRVEEVISCNELENLCLSLHHRFGRQQLIIP